MRREATLCGAAILAFAGFLVAMASWTPIQLDDWYEVDWLNHHSLADLASFAHYNYVNYNPRIGETFLLLLDGPRLIHCIVTPAMQLLFVAVIFALAHGRWARLTYRDLAALVVIQALIWLASPIPGPIYFYRPYTANYLFATCIELALLVPYRFAFTSASTRARPYLVPVFLAWGWLAGMGNEHTGPTAIVVAIAFSAWAWRRGVLRPWMIAGAVGLAAGFAMLVLAPGQAVRYANVAHGHHPMKTLLDRGVEGNLKFVADYVVEIAPALLVVGGALLVSLRRGAAMLTRAQAIHVLLAIAAALGIVMTSFASPIIEDRVFFAPCVATVIGLAIASAAASRARALLVGVAAIVVAVHVVAFVAVYRGIVERTDDRLALIERGRGTVALPPARSWVRDHWQFGEDFQNAYLRELVAHHFATVDGIELAGRPPWSQPNPPETASIHLVYDPPYAGDPLAGTPLGAHVPVQWAWAMRELRESWARLDGVAGHALKAIEVRIQPPQPVPGERPTFLMTWAAGRFTTIDMRTHSDQLGWPYAYADRSDLPIDPDEAWVEGCGVTERVELASVAHEVRIPIRYRCAGNHTLYLCDRRQCWLAWRFW